MSLYIFSTLILSLVFMLVFGNWWDNNAPFRGHVLMVILFIIFIFSTILMIATYPVLSNHIIRSKKRKNSDNITWGKDVSVNLSTPAAVVDGYTLIFANHAFLNDLGMSGMHEQIVGMPLTNIIHPSDHHNLARLISESKHNNTQNNQVITLRMLCYDGTILPVQMALSRIGNENSANLNLLQFSSESSLRSVSPSSNDQSHYQLLINQIEQIVFHINANGEIIFLNPSWEHLLGHPIPASTHQPLLNFFHPEDKPMVEARINSLTQGKRSSFHLQCRLIANNGHTIWVELRAKTTSAHKGERSSVIGTMADINRMKTIEASLRANRRSLTTLLSNIPGMIYRCKNDKNWSLEFVSDGSIDVLGYESNELISTATFSFAETIYHEDREMVMEIIQRGVASQKRYQMIYRLVTRSGEIKWVWEQGKGVYSNTGELLALEGFITDFSDQPDSFLLLKFRDLFLNQTLD